MLLIPVADENTNLLRKTLRKNIGKYQSYATLNFGRHLGHQTPSEENFTSVKSVFACCTLQTRLKN
jgi:hypothetical protein